MYGIVSKAVWECPKYKTLTKFRFCFRKPACHPRRNVKQTITINHEFFPGESGGGRLLCRHILRLSEFIYVHSRQVRQVHFRFKKTPNTELLFSPKLNQAAT